MKQLIAICSLMVLVGCSLLPRDHDPVMVDRLVVLSVQVEDVNCNQPDWKPALQQARVLSRYTEWRGDPQSENITGLYKHVERMSQGGSETFCTIGKRTAAARISAAKTAWEGR